MKAQNFSRYAINQKKYTNEYLKNTLNIFYACCTRICWFLKPSVHVLCPNTTKLCVLPRVHFMHFILFSQLIPITSIENINRLVFVICTECVLSEAGNEILHEDVIYMTVCIKIVQTDHTRPTLDIHEFSKILAFRLCRSPETMWLKTS